MAWARIETGLPAHPKTVELAAALGIPVDHAVGVVTSLLLWGQQAGIPSTGVIPLRVGDRDASRDASRDAAPDVSRASRILEHVLAWSGQAGHLLPALFEVGFLELGAKGELRIHDWADWNGRANERHQKKLEDQRERQERYRRRRAAGGDASRNRQRNASATGEHTVHTVHTVHTDVPAADAAGTACAREAPRDASPPPPAPTVSDATRPLPSTFERVARSLTPQGATALERLCRASPNATALLSEIEAVASAMPGHWTGPPPSWQAVDLALCDLSLNGGHVTGAALRKFVQRAQRDLEQPASGLSPAEERLDPYRAAGHRLFAKMTPEQQAEQRAILRARKDAGETVDEFYLREG